MARINHSRACWRFLLGAILLQAFPLRADSPPVKPNTFYVSPITTWIYSGIHDMPVVSLGYERQLSPSGWALFLPLHASYSQLDTVSSSYLIGGGLGIRKYIGRPFSGGYLTLQSDYAYRKESGIRSIWDGIESREERFSDGASTSITQLSFGYKWQWWQFALDMSIGGAFYILDDEKHTYPIGTLNVGFPFDARTFGL